MNKRLAVLSIILLSAFAGWFFLVRNPGTQENIWLGYVEGEALYIAAPVSGNLAERTVERGAPVKEGDRLFTLNAIITDADTARLQAELDAAQAEMADLQKQRQRPPELAVSRARQAAARAEVVRTDKQYGRISILADKGFATKTQLDSVKAAADVARANLAQTLAEEQSGQLTSGRVDQVRAAAAKIASAEAALKAQRERRNEIAPTAPAAGIIEQTFYNPGEWVPANSPILSILPDDRRKLRFLCRRKKWRH